MMPHLKWRFSTQISNHRKETVDDNSIPKSETK